MKDLSFEECSEFFNSRLNKAGLFFNTGSANAANTMTIGWGAIGVFWKKGIVIVPVRNTRYTYEILSGSDSFTVSIPIDNSMNKELSYCGSHSGRDGNKFESAGLTISKAKSVDGIIINECPVHIECKIRFTDSFNKDNLPEEIKDSIYSKGDYHTLYFGEIISAYRTDI